MKARMRSQSLLTKLLTVSLLIALIGEANMENIDDVDCPKIVGNSACPCYKFEDELFLECPTVTSILLKTNLRSVRAPIRSLSIYDFDRTVTTLTNDLFSTSSSSSDLRIKQIQISNSNIQALKDNSLINLKDSLESLSIVNGKLTKIPTKSLAPLQKLIILDFESNQIGEVSDNSFYGLHLAKLNMKGNRLENLPEYGFAGLEESLVEIDLSENRLTLFPIVSLIKMENLRSLRLSVNRITSIPQDAPPQYFTSLIFLDMSTNYLESLSVDYFRYFPVLRTLTLYNNYIGSLSNSFYSLRELQSLDISHNRLISCEHSIFQFNQRLRIVDMSHNHIHSIEGVFCNLPGLEEVLLSENNILELTNNCFSNSSSIKTIYLESNSIERLDYYVFHSLVNLTQLHLSNNYIKYLPSSIFERNQKLTSLTLDNNLIRRLESQVFATLVNLRELRLNDNLIERVDNQLFANLRDLVELYLQNNRIKSVEPEAFRQCQRLKYINIADNELIDVENIFNTNASLLSVQLNSNQIKFINHRIFYYQQNIQAFWLEHNNLKKLDKTLFVNLPSIERMYLKNNSIYLITDNTFDKMVKLRHLDLSINELMSINTKLFARLEMLEELNLSQNLITSIESNSFGKLKNLRTLDLSENRIGRMQNDLFMETMPSLYILNLRRTNLTKIDPQAFRGLINLNELQLDENYLHSWDMKWIDVPGLRTLRIVSNNFSSTMIRENMFDKLPSLNTLILVDCAISQLPDTLLTRNTNLVRIDLSRNRMKAINRNLFSRLAVFKELKLSKNLMNEFPHMALANISTLEVLALAENLIAYIDFFKLNGLPNLKQLDLRSNVITSISGFNVANLSHLDMIDLSGNLLFSLPSNFFDNSISLQRIDLAFNRFMQIPTSALVSKTFLTRLTWLNLTGNPLEKIYTEGTRDERFPHLIELHIRQTNLSILTSRDFEMFPALQVLYLSDNNINRISPGAFISLSSLQILDLSKNTLELLPKERLQGLSQLTILNASHNTLRDLEEFSSDLARLRTLDLSHNNLFKIEKETFAYLWSLRELNLASNRLTTIPMDSFVTLRKLEILDISVNKFESIPLNSLMPIETHVKHMRLAGNPIHCSCESQELWEFLHDHLKWKLFDTLSAEQSQLNCNQPDKLKGKDFLKMEPQDFCDAPLIVKLAIQDIQPFSVLVSWQSREHSGLNGYQVIYHSLEVTDEVKSMYFNRSSNSARLISLASNTLYLICVLGVGNWLTYQNDFNNTESTSHQIIASLANINNEVHPEAVKGLLTESMTSRCTQVRTLYALSSIMEMNSLSSNGVLHTLVTRRLGLIVGCFLGIFVFVILIIVLGWLKVKKRRIEQLKRAQMPQEFQSYRSYTVLQDDQHQVRDRNRPNGNYGSNTGFPSKNTNNDAVVVGKNSCKDDINCMNNGQHMHDHPNYISGATVPM